MNDLVGKVKERGGQSFTAKQLYNTMHVAHAGYRFKNQGMAMTCDWRTRGGNVNKNFKEEGMLK